MMDVKRRDAHIEHNKYNRAPSRWTSGMGLEFLLKSVRKNRVHYLYDSVLVCRVKKLTTQDVLTLGHCNRAWLEGSEAFAPFKSAIMSWYTVNHCNLPNWMNDFSLFLLCKLAVTINNWQEEDFMTPSLPVCLSLFFPLWVILSHSIYFYCAEWWFFISTITLFMRLASRDGEAKTEHGLNFFFFFFWCMHLPSGYQTFALDFLSGLFWTILLISFVHCSSYHD